MKDPVKQAREAEQQEKHRDGNEGNQDRVRTSRLLHAHQRTNRIPPVRGMPEEAHRNHDTDNGRNRLDCQRGTPPGQGQADDTQMAPHPGWTLT